MIWPHDLLQRWLSWIPSSAHQMTYPKMRLHFPAPWTWLSLHLTLTRGYDGNAVLKLQKWTGPAASPFCFLEARRQCNQSEHLTSQCCGETTHRYWKCQSYELSYRQTSPEEQATEGVWSQLRHIRAEPPAKCCPHTLIPYNCSKKQKKLFKISSLG